MEWSDEVIGQLRALWAEGHSTAEIGRRLGVTKNAIVGKAHRLDLPARPSPIRRDPDAAPERRAAVRRVDGPTLPPLPSTVTEGEMGFPAYAPAPTNPGPITPGTMNPGGMSTGGMAPGAMPRAAAQALVQSAPASMPPRSPVIARPIVAPVAPRPVVQALRPVAALPPHRPVAAVPRPYGRVVTCCWPIGEPGTPEFRFCDVPSEPGRPYCEDHVKVAYVKVRDRREDAA
jgi:GcrA cell cycle regulator